VALLGFAGLVAVALLTFYDGAARWVGAPRISGFSDYGELFYPLVIASCFPAVLMRQSNITVTLLGRALGPRGNAWLEALAAWTVLAFFAVLVWQFAALTAGYAAGGRTTRTISMPLAPFWVGTTAVMALCVPVQAYVAWAWTRAALRGGPPGHAGLRHGAEG
jgi:TRAP-type C4-dicarboxylate transport system permease small subunit